MARLVLGACSGRHAPARASQHDGAVSDAPGSLDGAPALVDTASEEAGNGQGFTVMPEVWHVAPPHMASDPSMATDGSRWFAVFSTLNPDYHGRGGPLNALMRPLYVWAFDENGQALWHTMVQGWGA